MKLAFLVTCATAWLAGCSGSGDAGGGFGGGSGGSGGGGGAPSQSSSSGSGGSGGTGGVEDCAATEECGDLATGCVGCAISTTCAGPYATCAQDPSCTKFGACLEPCDPKNLDCVHECETQFPGASAEYAALIACVMCDVCASQCMTPSTSCM